MRPQPGGDAHSSSFQPKPRSRKSSVDLHVPTTFVMKRVEDLDHPSGMPQLPTTASKKRASAYGVQTLADTLEAAFGPGATSNPVDALGEENNQGKKTPRSGSQGSSTGTTSFTENASPSLLRNGKRVPSGHAVPTPATPSSFDIPIMSVPSVMSTPPRSASMASLKLSDEESILDDSTSQAIASSEDEEDEEVDAQHIRLESFPQLVMPSIQMPTRRPFTTKGKAMGKLKLMVAGRTGIGKSSLIRSIVQVCEDIVHVDPLSPCQPIPQPPVSRTKARTKKSNHPGTVRITESHASTKPYPHWWTETEESRKLRRRKSNLDSILERNICFVDTPGFSEGQSEKHDIDTVVNYVETMLYQTASVATLADNDVLGVVSGSGGIAVDVVLFLLPPDKDLTKDIEFMQRLSYLTNVIPVIARSDTLSARETIALKTSILSRLQATSVRPFLFGKELDDALLAVQSLSVSASSTSNEPNAEPSQFAFATPTHPYLISSTLGPDSDNMDASLLMSSEYIQPLISSELPALVSQIFDPESIAWLRHSAAKRFLAWRRRMKLSGDLPGRQPDLQPQSPTTASIGLPTAINSESKSPPDRPLLTLVASAGSSVFSAASPSGVLVPRSGSPFYGSNLQSPFLASSPSLALSEPHDIPTNFSLTRWTNQNQFESNPSELRIAKWATDLKRSLRNERDRYEELQREDRKKWLLGIVGEEMSGATTITAAPGDVPRADWAVIKHSKDRSTKKHGLRYVGTVGLDSRDPLGLCSFTDGLRRQGFVLVKVLGGLSLLGAVVVTVARACHFDLELPQDGWWVWLAGGAE